MTATTTKSMGKCQIKLSKVFNNILQTEILRKSAFISSVQFVFFTDIGEIYSRLFDCRPFLNGEVKYFLREFEVSCLFDTPSILSRRNF